MLNEMQYQPKNYLQTSDERQMGLFLHLSHLANFLLFPAGIVLPIILWQTQKEKMPALDAHGREAVNWIISSTIYHLINFVFLGIGVVLLFVGIGFFLILLNVLIFLAIGIAGAVFSVIAAVKASEGDLWEYPLTIKFLK